MDQVARVLTDADDGVLGGHRIFICDRDTKWSAAFRRTLAGGGVHVIQTPFQAPNCNAHAERFVRSIKDECLDRLVVIGAGHLRRTLTAFTAHYNGERNHQGLDNRLIAPAPTGPPTAKIHRRDRLGGLLKYYHRAA
jgi:transposase InsO family protein